MSGYALHAWLVSWQKHAETVFFGGVSFSFCFLSQNLGIGCNFPHRPVFLAHCSWEFFLILASFCLSLSLSFSGCEQELRQWKGTWEVGKREGFGERKLVRDLGVEKAHFPDQLKRKMALFDPRAQTPHFGSEIYPQKSRCTEKVTEFQFLRIVQSYGIVIPGNLVISESYRYRYRLL